MATRESKIVLTAEDKTAAAFESAKRNMESAARAADSLHSSFKTFTTAGGILAVLQGLNIFQKYQGILETAEGFNKLAQKTGVATETLSAYTYAAKLSDVSQEDLSTGLKKLAVNMSEAAGGSKEQIKVFDALGIKVTDAGGKLRGTDEVLGELADRFAGFADGPAKAALAVALFGKSGDSMIPFLNNFRELTDEGRKFGAVYGADFARKAEEFNDNLKRLSLAGEAAKVAFLSKGGLFDALVSLTEQMVEGIRIAGGFKAALMTLGTINPFKSLGENIQGVTADLDRMKEARARLSDAKFSDSELYRAALRGSDPKKEREAALRELDQDIQKATKQREFLKFQQRQSALADAGNPAHMDARDLAARAAKENKPQAPVIEKGEEKKKEADALAALLKNLDLQIAKTNELSHAEQVLIELQDEKYDKYSKVQKSEAFFRAIEVDNAMAAKATRDLVQSLDEQIAKVGELTVVQELEIRLNEKKYQFLTQAQREAIVGKAKELQAAKDGFEYYKAEVKAVEDATRAIADHAQRQAELADRYRDMADPTREFLRQLEEINKLREQWQKSGGREGLSPQEAFGAEWAVQNRLQDALDQANKSSEKLADGAQQIGMAFQSAFEDAVLEGKEFGRIMDALGKDIARAMMRALITQPLVNAVANNASSWLNWLGGAVSGARAEGGPVTGGQTYLVGEKGPELFVPGASGSIVPNGAMGGVSVVNHYNIDARADRASIVAEIRASEQRTVARVLDAQQRGHIRLAG